MDSRKYKLTDLKFESYKEETIYKAGNVAVQRCHRGQRKLALSEIFFLTLYSEPGDVVVYAGAADGKHIPFVASMFPEVAEWYLFDPCISGKDEQSRNWHENVITWDKKCENCHVVTNYFNNNVARKLFLKHRDKKILLISDIRADAYNEESIMNDMAMQEQWVTILNVKKACLKWRLPYPTKDLDCVSVKNGDLYMGIFAPVNSTEGRLVCDPSSGAQEWNLKEVEQRFAYFNRTVREKDGFDFKAQMYVLSLYCTMKHGKELDWELCNDFDRMLKDNMRVQGSCSDPKRRRY